jgi:hypothetical protein
LHRLHPASRKRIDCRVEPHATQMVKTIVIGAGVMGASVSATSCRCGRHGSGGDAHRWRHLRHQLRVDQRKESSQPRSRSQCRRHKGACRAGRRVMAPRRGGAAAVWNGWPNPIARAQRKNIEQLRSWVMPRGGSPFASTQNWSPTERSARRRQSLSLKQVGSTSLRRAAPARYGRRDPAP